MQNGLVVPVKKNSISACSTSNFPLEKSSTEMAAMIAFKTISNQINTTSINKNEKPAMANSLHQNIQLSNNGSKFSIADILGFSSIEAIASSLASSTPSLSLLSNSKQSSILNTKSTTTNIDFNVEDYGKINENSSFNEKRLQNNIKNPSSLSNVNFQQINNFISSNKTSDLHNERLQLNRNFNSKFQNSDGYPNNTFSQLTVNNHILKNDKANEYRQQNISSQSRKTSISSINQNLSAIKYKRIGHLSDEKMEQNSEKSEIEYDSEEDEDEDENGNYAY